MHTFIAKIILSYNVITFSLEISFLIAGGSAKYIAHHSFSPGTLIKMSNVMTFEAYPYLTAATALSYCIREFFILLPKRSVSLPLEDAAKVSLIASNSKFCRETAQGLN